eukprot:582456-Prorocentrum_minimum.AAC.2
MPITSTLTPRTGGREGGQRGIDHHRDPDEVRDRELHRPGRDPMVSVAQCGDVDGTDLNSLKTGSINILN